MKNTEKTIVIRINYKDMSWDKMVQYDPNVETIEEVIEDEQNGWEAFMLSNDPNFDKDFLENLDTYDIMYQEAEVIYSYEKDLAVSE